MFTRKWEEVTRQKRGSRSHFEAAQQLVNGKFAELNRTIIWGAALRDLRRRPRLFELGKERRQCNASASSLVVCYIRARGDVATRGFEKP